MELVEGHVRLTFDLGSGALVLTSKRKYNTGVWFKITLQRNKRKGTSPTTTLRRFRAVVQCCNTTAKVLRHSSQSLVQDHTAEDQHKVLLLYR